MRSPYILRRRPIAEGKPGLGGWGDKSLDGEVVARIDTAALHAGVARAAVDALRAGVLGELERGFSIAYEDSVGIIPVDAGTVRASLDRRLREVRRQQRNYAKLAGEANDASVAADYNDHAKAAAGRVRELQADLDQLDECKPDAPTEVRSDAWYVVEGLANLANTKGTVDRAVAEALRAIIEDLRLELSDDGFTVDFSYKLRVPAGEGHLVLGPIAGVVPVRPAIVHAVTKHHTGERRAKILDLFEAGLDAIEISQRVDDCMPRVAVTHLEVGMADAGMVPASAIALAACGVSSTRQAVISVARTIRDARAYGSDWEGLAARVADTGLELPAGVTAEWAGFAALQYLDPGNADRPSSWIRAAGRQQAVVDAIGDLGGQALLDDVVAAVARKGYPLARHEVAETTRSTSSSGAHWPALTEAVGGWTLAPYPEPKNHEIALRPCHNCGQTATRVIHVPELPTKLLCKCGRMPFAGSPLVPFDYLALPVQTTRRKVNLYRKQKSRSRAERAAVAATSGASGDQTVGHRRRPERSDDERRAVADAYRAGQVICGSGGILETFDVTAHGMYKILAEFDVSTRAPRAKPGAAPS